MKPLIGVNVDIEGDKPKRAAVQANYYESISRAGGLPVLIPPVSDDDLLEILSRLDGVMLIGGLDYCPSLYGEDRHDSVEIAHNDRVDFDFRLLKKCIEFKTKPLLGICAGAQIINIGLGGSLHQDIPSDFPHSVVTHSSANGWLEGFSEHKVKVSDGTKLGQIYKVREFSVPTSHHQAVKQLGRGLEACAFAEDGIIEAVELKDYPFIVGVQWHPERDYEGNKELFTAFVKASNGNTSKN